MNVFNFAKWIIKNSVYYFAILYSILISFFKSYSLTYEYSFSTVNNIESYDLIHNSGLSEFHSKIQLQNWIDQGGPKGPTLLDFGDGSHGIFDESTMSKFGTINGNILVINTNLYYPLKVTSFNLPSGWILKPEGTNPLEIQSQTDITINGIINCSGDDGEGINSNNSVLSLGGVGRCGGGDGGNGATLSSFAEDGESGGSELTVPGLGANGINSAPASNATGSSGGSGGGGYRQLGAPAEQGYDTTQTVWGALATNYRDDGFEKLGSGSGGGGGDFYGGTDVPNRSSGGGGGAGGGTIYLSAARDINLNGSLLANGGSGGGTLGTLRAGGGGGGAGGSVKVWAGRTLNFSGSIQALGGSGGQSGIDDADAPTGDAPNQGRGGNGSDGRTWIADNNGCSGTCPGIEDPSSLLIDLGESFYEIGSYTIETKVIDFENTAPTVESIEILGTLGTGGTITTFISTSTLNEPQEFTDWVEISSQINLPLKRFLKFKFEIVSGDGKDPVHFSGFRIAYTGHEQNKFELVSTCGSLNDKNATKSIAWLMYFLFPILFVFLFKRKLNHNHVTIQ